MKALGGIAPDADRLRPLVHVRAIEFTAAPSAGLSLHELVLLDQGCKVRWLWDILAHPFFPRRALTRAAHLASIHSAAANLKAR